MRALGGAQLAPLLAYMHAWGRGCVAHTLFLAAADRHKGADRRSTRRQLRCVPGLTARFEALLAAVKAAALGVHAPRLWAASKASKL